MTSTKTAAVAKELTGLRTGAGRTVNSHCGRGCSRGCHRGCRRSCRRSCRRGCGR